MCHCVACNDTCLYISKVISSFAIRHDSLLFHSISYQLFFHISLLQLVLLLTFLSISIIPMWLLLYCNELSIQTIYASLNRNIFRSYISICFYSVQITNRILTSMKLNGLHSFSLHNFEIFHYLVNFFLLMYFNSVCSNCEAHCFVGNSFE